MVTIRSTIPFTSSSSRVFQPAGIAIFPAVLPSFVVKKWLKNVSQELTICNERVIFNEWLKARRTTSIHRASLNIWKDDWSGQIKSDKILEEKKKKKYGESSSQPKLITIFSKSRRTRDSSLRIFRQRGCKLLSRVVSPRLVTNFSPALGVVLKGARNLVSLVARDFEITAYS